MAQHVNAKPAIHIACFCGYPPSFFLFGIRHSLTHLAMSDFINLSAHVTGSPLTPFYALWMSCSHADIGRVP